MVLAAYRVNGKPIHISWPPLLMRRKIRRVAEEFPYDGYGTKLERKAAARILKLFGLSPQETDKVLPEGDYFLQVDGYSRLKLAKYVEGGTVSETMNAPVFFNAITNLRNPLRQWLRERLPRIFGKNSK